MRPRPSRHSELRAPNRAKGQRPMDTILFYTWVLSMITDQDEVNDGILDRQKWDKTFPKILFLFKEATKKSDWKEIAGNPINTNNGDNPRFWPNVLLRKHAMYGIFNERRVPPYPTSWKDTKEHQTNNGYLDEIAYVNFKKKLGESTSDSGLIARIASENRKALSTQIDTIKPTVVYCCRTNFNAYQAIYPDDKIENLAQDIYTHNQRFIITFYHPSYWFIGPERLYQLFSDILSQPAFVSCLNPS
jgi:hypothetical protein